MKSIFQPEASSMTLEKQRSRLARAAQSAVAVIPRRMVGRERRERRLSFERVHLEPQCVEVEGEPITAGNRVDEARRGRRRVHVASVAFEVDEVYEGITLKPA